MPTVSITVSAAHATELNAIAVAAGFLNVRAMTRAYLRAEIKAWRAKNAVAGIREAAEAQADADTSTIS